MRMVSASLALGLVNCASPQQTASTSQRRAVAVAKTHSDIEPPQVLPVAKRIEPLHEASAGDLLELALFHLRNDNARSAAESFQAAIDTGYLSDAGRALAYWYIHLSEKTLGRMGRSAEALLSFTVLAEDLIQNRIPGASSQSEDFVTQFDLTRRLALGRAVLSATWSHQAKGFGETADHPVPVYDSVELTYYVELTSPCSDDSPANFHRKSIDSTGGFPIQRVTLYCQPTNESFEYFFELKGRDTGTYSAAHHIPAY